jgi:hypothetical protein
MPAYDYVLHRVAVLGAMACEDAQTIRIFHAIESLTEDPHRSADFYGSDATGRSLSWIKSGGFAIGYLTDHSGKLIHVFDIRQIVA